MPAHGTEDSRNRQEDTVPGHGAAKRRPNLPRVHGALRAGAADHGGLGPARLRHGPRRHREVHPACPLHGDDGQAGGRPGPDGGGGRQRGRPDDPLLLRVQARRDPRDGQKETPGCRCGDLPQARRHRDRRGLHGPGRPDGLRGRLPQGQRPREGRPLRRPADDPHRRSLPAAARCGLSREDAVQDALPQPLLLQRPRL